MREDVTTPGNLGALTASELESKNMVAVVDLGLQGERAEYSFHDLDMLSGGVARLLTGMGLPIGSRIGIAADNRVEYIACCFGIMRGGYVAVPLNVKLPEDNLSYIIDDANVQMVFCDGQRTNFPWRVPVCDFDNPAQGGFWQVVHPMDSQEDAILDLDGDAVAEVLYTSGSTGRPKGVPLTHSGQLWALETLPGFTEGEGGAKQTTLVAQPLYHMNGQFAVCMALKGGHKTVLMPSFESRQYAMALRDCLVTEIVCVPTMWVRVLKEIEQNPGLTPTRLRGVVLGSAPVSRELLERTKALLPWMEVKASYGTTEAGPAVFGPHPEGKMQPMASVGYPLAGSEVRLVGKSDDEGVLWMRNPAVTPGYLNSEDETGAFVQNGWYISGDVMRRDSEGFYYFIGRADDMFVCGGENIYPSYVESAIESHPDVFQAVVVPLPDYERGHVPVAFIVGRPGLHPEDVKVFVRSRGPSYMYPRHVVTMDRLPFAGTNKIDRSALELAAVEMFGQKGGDR